MTRHRTNSPPPKRGTATTLTSLLATGAAGVAAGGPVWGFLGATVLLFCVGWVYHLIQYDQGTDQIERYYNPPVTVPVRWHTRPFVLIPLRERESIPQ